jgi:hypothetical protein
MDICDRHTTTRQEIISATHLDLLVPCTICSARNVCIVNKAGVSYELITVVRRKKKIKETFIIYYYRSHTWSYLIKVFE